MSKVLYFTLDENAVMPTRAHKYDAGYDLFTPYTFTIEPRKPFTLKTGVHVHIPEGYVGMIKSKSGLNTKHDIRTEGVIDCGYTGEIHVHLFNYGDKPYTFLQGDKVTQLVVIPCYIDDSMYSTDDKRGDNGFGSTGK